MLYALTAWGAACVRQAIAQQAEARAATRVTGAKKLDLPRSADYWWAFAGRYGIILGLGLWQGHTWPTDGRHILAITIGGPLRLSGHAERVYNTGQHVTRAEVFAMPRANRPRRERTHDWQKIKQYTLWPEQQLYEKLRTITLFNESAAERARETGTPERTLQRQVERFGRRPSHHTVQRVLASGPQPSITARRFPLYNEIADGYERRCIVVRLHAEGWSISTISAYMQTTRATIYDILKRWAKEGKEGLKDRSHAPHEPARKVNFEDIQEVLLATEGDSATAHSVVTEKECGR
jgi:hypothetical protein